MTEQCLSTRKPLYAGGVAASDITSGQVALARGGTASDLSATGPGFLYQASGGAVVTIVGADVSATELGYLDGVTSAIQTQLDAKLPLGGGTMTGYITLHSDPSTTMHAVTKQYVDALLNGLRWKAPVRAATTSLTGGTLANDFENGDTVDGVTLATGDRILLKNFASASDNGIYIVAASGAPSRATDADAFGELNGAAVMVQEGTTNGNAGFVQTTELTSLSDSQVWVQNFGTGTYNADESTLTLNPSGNVFSINSGGITNTHINGSAAIAISKLGTSTSTAIGVGSIELGHASDTTIARSAAGVVTIEGIEVVTISATQSLTNKRITDVVTTLTDGATINIDWSLGRKFEVLIAGNREITFSNFVAGMEIELRVQQDGAGSRLISTWPGGGVMQWAGGAAPTLATTGNHADIIKLNCRTGPLFDGGIILADIV